MRAMTRLTEGDRQITPPSAVDAMPTRQARTIRTRIAATPRDSLLTVKHLQPVRAIPVRTRMSEAVLLRQETATREHPPVPGKRRAAEPNRPGRDRLLELKRNGCWQRFGRGIVNDSERNRKRTPPAGCKSTRTGDAVASGPLAGCARQCARWSRSHFSRRAISSIDRTFNSCIARGRSSTSCCEIPG